MFTCMYGWIGVYSVIDDRIYGLFSSIIYHMYCSLLSCAIVVYMYLLVS